MASERFLAAISSNKLLNIILYLLNGKIHWIHIQNTKAFLPSLKHFCTSHLGHERLCGVYAEILWKEWMLNNNAT